jgi:hypothetical protein
MRFLRHEYGDGVGALVQQTVHADEREIADVSSLPLAAQHEG